MEFPRREVLFAEWSRLRATIDEHPAWWRTSSTFLAFFLLAVTFQAMFQLLQTVIALPRPGARRRLRVIPAGAPDDAAPSAVFQADSDAPAFGAGDTEAAASGPRLLPAELAVAGSGLLALAHAAYWTLLLWLAATLTDTTAQAALLLSVAAVPNVVIAIAGRSLADRADGRLVVFALRLLVTAALASLALLAARDALTGPAFAGITLALGIMWSLQRSAPLADGSSIQAGIPLALAAVIAPVGVVAVAANVSLGAAFAILGAAEFAGATIAAATRAREQEAIGEALPIGMRAGRSLFVLALIPSTLGGGILAFLPAIALNRLHIGLDGFGALTTALGAGFAIGMLASAGSGWLRPRVIAGVAVSAVSLVALIYVLAPAAAAGLLALYGFGAGLATGSVLCSPRTSTSQRARAAALALPLTSMSPLATLAAAGLAAQFSVVVAAWLFAIGVSVLAGLIAFTGGIAWLMGYEEVPAAE